jgi:hypothetical protein
MEVHLRLQGMTKPFMFVMLSIISLATFCQDKNACAGLHDGVFYYYPKNSNNQFVSFRRGNELKEVQLGKKDTSFWSIKWMDPCTYEIKYRAGGTLNSADKQFINEHSLVYRITGSEKDYYTMEGFIDKTNNMRVIRDTFWLHPLEHPSNEPLFTELKNETVLKRQKFSDTSKYAVLYVYRSKKIGQMLVDYPVYLDHNLLFVAHNNSSGVYKVLKEGPASFFGNIVKHTSNAMIDFKFGKKYFLKCDIHLGIYSRPDLIPMDAEKGREQFDEIGL